MKHMRKLIAVATTAIAISSVAKAVEPAISREDVREHWHLLENMVNASANKDYKAIFLYQKGRGVEPIELKHVVIGSTEKERLTYLSGDHKVLLRDGDLVTAWHDGQVQTARQQIARTFPTALFSDKSTVQSRFSLSTKPLSRIANRTCSPLLLAGMAKEPYSYEVCVDRQTFLPLEVVVFASKSKQQIERLTVVSIELMNRVNPRDFALDALIQDHLVALKNQQQNTSNEVTDAISSAFKFEMNTWPKSVWLPAGFSVAKSVLVSADGAPINHLICQNGQKQISIYVQAKSTLSETDALEGRRTVSGQTLIWDQPKSDMQVTVVGELTEKDAKKIASSIQL